MRREIIPGSFYEASPSCGRVHSFDGMLVLLGTERQMAASFRSIASFNITLIVKFRKFCPVSLGILPLFFRQNIMCSLFSCI